MALLIAAIAAPVSFLWASGVAVSAGSTVVETETMTIASDSDTHPYNDTAASGGKGLSWPGNDVVNGSVTTSATTTTLTLRMRGDLCNGGPNAIVKVDGTTLLTAIASTATFADYSATVNTAGTHSISITYSNDTKTSSCDRNLRTDKLTFVAASGGGDTTPPAAPTGLRPRRVTRRRRLRGTRTPSPISPATTSSARPRPVAPTPRTTPRSSRRIRTTTPA